MKGKSKRENLTLAGRGRLKGVPNKLTSDVRATVALIAERNVPKFEQWLTSVRDPARRCELFLRMLEYHIPKLTRSELSGTLTVAPSEEAFLKLATALKSLESQPSLVLASPVAALAAPVPEHEVAKHDSQESLPEP